MPAAEPARLRNPFDRDLIRSRSVRDPTLVGTLQDEVGRRLHEILEPLVDALLAPAFALQVLHPFQVANRDAAGAAEDVRDHPHAAVLEEHVAVRGGGMVRELEDEVRTHTPALSDLIDRSRAAGASTSHSTPIRSS